ncbi:MAG: succinate CoA transferase [Akkermansiaceae bacterium]|jgi:acetyl-CoA hydrolase|nr:succinate CoA transferase [Akkermansiaceae bacterium]
MNSPFPVLTPEEAAAFIQHDQTIGFSGFTPAGAAKVIPTAIASKAIAEHEAGRDFKIGVITGASTGPSLDGELAKADAIKFRTPYQSDKDLRASINAGKTHFFDMHLSLLPQYVRYGFLGQIDWAVVEAADVSVDGKILLTTSVGAAPTFLSQAKRVLIEVNKRHPKELLGFHDIYEPASPPHRRPIPICAADDRIGTQRVWVDSKKIAGIVHSNRADEVRDFSPVTDVTTRIGLNVAEFLAAEIRNGHIPKTFLPIQSGVGNVANAVLGAMGDHPEIPRFQMYSEVIQDSVIDLVKQDRCSFVSGVSLTVTDPVLQGMYDNLDFFRGRLLLRPQEIANNPEIVRRIGIISINTALEADIFGNINSTHVLGQKMMNGIGGSGDFTRNAYISIFTCPSTAKDGNISAIVPMCSHMDHSEHSVQVLVTEHGVADLRGKDPRERAEAIITNCVDPSYRDLIWTYFKLTENGHTPQTFRSAFAFHEAFLETGDMRNTKF